MRAHCLEFCHPHPITKLHLLSWAEVEEVKKFQKAEDQEQNAAAVSELKQEFGVQECNSLVVGEFFACFGELRKVYND